jgi:hypothetical protein
MSLENAEEVEEEVRIINTTDITKPSNLTADELNEIIDTHLENIGQSFSKIDDIGEFLVEMEEETGVNAIFCLAVGSLESGHGTSIAAVNKNNLFGLIGSNGLMKFNSVSECISYWGNLIRTYYMDCGRTSVSSIQTKYCPDESEWAVQVNSLIKTYASYVDS